MENYDPEFGKIAKPGDILVGGRNFGTGSSREQVSQTLVDFSTFVDKSGFRRLLHSWRSRFLSSLPPVSAISSAGTVRISNTLVSSSFSLLTCSGINNALMGVEVPKLVERLREAFKDDQNKPKTRRTGWKLTWDVRRSKVIVTEADGKTWEQKVGELPPNVQGKIATPLQPNLGDSTNTTFTEIASQGLEAWIKAKSQA